MCRCLIALTTLLLVAVGSSTEKAASFVVNSGAAEALIARQAAEGYLQKATKALRRLIDRMSAVEPDLTRQLWLADLQDQAGDLPGALDTASRLLGETEASSWLESAVLEEIASWFIRDDYQGLRLYYQELAARYPTRAILRQRLGEQARNADEASSYFESALSLTCDGNESVWAAYCESLRRHQADKEALKVIARWHKAHAPNADLAWIGVEIAMTLKDPALQEEAGNRYLQASAHSAHALRRLAAYQEFHDHVRPAERTLRSSVLIHPTDSELKFALLSFRKRHGQAVDFPFETSRNARLGMSERKANALADPSARGARRLVQLALRENDLPTALKHLEQWKARDPSDPRAWLQQAHLLALSEKGAAISLLEEAHRRSPSDSAIAESLLTLYLERRRNQEGLALITTMMGNASSKPERTRWQERRVRMLDVLEVPIREQTDWLPRNVATARRLQEEVSLTAQDWLHLGRRAFFHNRKSWATKWLHKALQLDDCLENCRAHIHLLGHTDFILAALQERLGTESHPATALELLHLLASRRDWAAVHKLARAYRIQSPDDYRFSYFEGVALAELGWSEASQEVFLGLLAHDDGLLSSRSLFPPPGFFFAKRSQRSSGSRRIPSSGRNSRPFKEQRAGLPMPVSLRASSLCLKI